MSHLRTGNLNKSIPFNIPASVLPFEYSVTSSFQERQEVWKEFPDAVKPYWDTICVNYEGLGLFICIKSNWISEIL